MKYNSVGLTPRLLKIIFILCTILFFIKSVLAEESLAELANLQRELNEAMLQREYLKALPIAEKINEIIESHHLENLYHIVQLHCLLGNREKAYEWLHRAIDAGFWDAKRMREDSLLSLIKGDEYFKILNRTAWSNGYLYMLEREEREDFQMKKEILEALDLKPGLKVADIGAGSGYFTIPVAKAILPGGEVLATDIFDQMLKYIDRRLKVEDLKNVKLLKVERDDPQLPPAGMDLILMVDVFHYIQDRSAYGRELRKGLAPGGRLVVIDYKPKPWEERPWGPPPEQQVAKEMLTEELARAGLKLIKEYAFLPEQYFMIYSAE